MTVRLFGAVIALVLVAGLAGGGAQAAAMRGEGVGKVEYRIMHSKYDEIGSHVVTFSRHGAELVVDVTIKIQVKFLFITAHSLVAERREVWRDGRFVGYSSHTDENSELFDVVAHAEGAKLAIEGPEGRSEADGSVFPSDPWNPQIVKATTVMDTKTGKLLSVAVATEGSETIEVAGKAVETSKYRVSGDLERELWYDTAGNWIQLRFPKDGETLTFTRVTPLD